MADIRTSVIVPAWNAWATLPAVLDALEPQVAGRARELIVVDSTGDATPERIAERWPWVRVIAFPGRMLPGRARNEGVRAARGELVAFTDADAVPAPDWLDRLERALGRNDAACGAVTNGTPASPTGTAQWLLEFSEWLPSRRQPPDHAATCNLMVRRSVFERDGPFREDVWPGEDTIFTFELGRRGQLAFAPDAVVAHRNRIGLRAFLRHQRRLGGAYVAIARAVPFPYAWVARPWFAPLAVPLRVLALVRRLRHEPAERGRAIRLAPLLLLGLAAWAAGIVRPPTP